MPARQAGRRATAAQREKDAAEVINALRRVYKAVHEYSKAIHRKVGLSGPQVWALSILGENPGLSLGELSRRMFAHPSTVSGVVDRLVERGSVLREVDPEDRRGIRLTLTPQGRRLLKASPPPVQSGLARAMSAMPAARLRELSRSLDELARRAELDRIDAPLFDVDE